MKLKQYNFRIEYRQGSANADVDFLSRHPINQLNEFTEISVIWAEAERIEQAHQQCALEDIPKGVRNVRNGASQNLCT